LKNVGERDLKAGVRGTFPPNPFSGWMHRVLYVYQITTLVNEQRLDIMCHTRG
jgi:hypothetical protein